ncbi:unnamed protein product [Moneuplotes crassus]|uniref:SUMO-activating enzyme subunit n=2 Tax=Euplotes crassus TaxID=5936 RepID=A0AAD1U6Z0_EUPCR|nr:unnamed protein product [Moneuplotes crassus]
MTGFKQIEVVDMDTIDISNLNRQFLFTREDVGKHKSECAAKAIKRRFPALNIKHYVGNIKDGRFDSDFFKSFDLIYNALDNIDARKHVNRVCISLNRPLIDGGSTGYIGTTVSILKDKTPCYECIPKPTPKQFPVCTIRATPDKMIHCIVWAKYLLNALFGDQGEVNFLEDIREELSEVVKNGDYKALATKVFTKVFDEEIHSQLELRNKKQEYGKSELKEEEIKVIEMLRKKELQPLDSTVFNTNPEEIKYEDKEGNRKDTEIWDISLYVQLFYKSIESILTKYGDKVGHIEFDKDDEILLGFIIACSNLRAYNYNIAKETGFKIKEMAGNIIPAISSTNGIVAGMEVIEGLKILSGQTSKLKAVTFSSKNADRVITSSDITQEINKNCQICSNVKPLYKLTVDEETFKLQDLIEKVLKKDLSISSPTLECGGKIFFETGDDLDEDEIEEYEHKLPKLLKGDLNVGDKYNKIRVDDFLQDFTCDIELHYSKVVNKDENPQGYIFEIVVEGSQKQNPSKEEAKIVPEQDKSEPTYTCVDQNSDDVIIADPADICQKTAVKRKSDELEEIDHQAKRSKITI